MNKIKLGVDTLLWSENFCSNDIRIISRAKELGCDTIDIAISDPDSFPVEEVKRALEKIEINVVLTHALSQKNNPISTDGQIRKNGTKTLKRCIDIGNAIGAEILSGVTYAAWGYKSGKPRTEQEWNWSVQHMKEVCSYAGETGNITIAAEIINRYVTHFLNTSEDGVKYCRETAMPNLKIHLDSFHMMIEENSFREAILQSGKEFLGYFHACESHRGIPGTGLVPWKEVIQTLREIDYSGSMVIEAYDPGFDTISSNSCIWRKFAESGEDFAKKGLGFLTRILND